MSVHRPKIFLAAFVINFLEGQVLYSSVISEEESNPFFDQLALINTYTPLEGAGSHGSWGGSLGLAMHHVPRSEKSDQLPASLEDRSTLQQQDIPRIIINKGLFYPLDVGVNFGLPLSNTTKIFGAHAQVSLFERFNFPAIAIRTSYSQTSFLKESNITTWGWGPEVSYGFFRYFNAYGGMQWQTHRSSLQPTATTTRDIMLMRNSSSDTVDTGGGVTINKQWKHTQSHLGIMVHPSTETLVNLCFESLYTKGSSKSYFFKLSFGI